MTSEELICSTALMSSVESDVSPSWVFLELLNKVIACIFSDLQKDFWGKCVVENWFKGILTWKQMEIVTQSGPAHVVSEKCFKN